jgi:hypothetical protein
VIIFEREKKRGLSCRQTTNETHDIYILREREKGENRRETGGQTN